jgi:predicted dithiol-disulfide oxidoreductase (DUF899 family)
MVVRLISKLILAAVCFSGCATQNAGTEDRDRYVDFCREMARAPIPEREDPEDFMTKPDWMVHPCSLTTQEFKKDYKVVYADRQCLSFSCCDYAYTGGAHGNTTARANFQCNTGIFAIAHEGCLGGLQPGV